MFAQCQLTGSVLRNNSNQLQLDGGGGINVENKENIHSIPPILTQSIINNNNLNKGIAEHNQGLINMNNADLDPLGLSSVGASSNIQCLVL